MPVHVVLYSPEIPQNTGNIIRTCVACDVTLHLIEPIGFDLEKKHIRRSTTNHLEHARIQVYPDFAAFSAANPGEYFFLTRYGKRAHSSFDFAEFIEKGREIYLIFGKESTGIPYELLRERLDRCFRIPMAPKCRSLNLANSVAIALYEVMRQVGFPGLSFTEVEKGEDFLESFDLQRP